MRAVSVRKGAYEATISLPTADDERFAVRAVQRDAKGHPTDLTRPAIAEQFPELSDVIALDDTDRRGKPRFAIEHAVEYISTRQLNRAAKLLRVQPTVLADMEADRRKVSSFCRSCEPWWAIEADRVFEKYAPLAS